MGIVCHPRVPYHPSPGTEHVFWIRQIRNSSTLRWYERLQGSSPFVKGASFSVFRSLKHEGRYIEVRGRRGRIARGQRCGYGAGKGVEVPPAGSEGPSESRGAADSDAERPAGRSGAGA